MTDKEYVYVDPFGRHWTKENLDGAMRLLRSLKENNDTLDYY